MPGNGSEKLSTRVDDPHDSWDAGAFDSRWKEAETNDNERKDPPPIDISKLAEKGSGTTGEVDEEMVKAVETALKEKEQAEKKETDGIYSIKSKQRLYGAAEDAVKKKFGTFETETKADTKVSENPDSGPVKEKSARELAIERQAKKGASPEQLKAYEGAYDNWKTARERAHKLEEEYNEKYKAHIAGQSVLLRGVRKAFGFQPKLNDELRALQGASTIARREYQAAGQALAEARITKPMVKYSALTKTPSEFGGKEAVEKRYERMLAYHLITHVHRGRLENQRQAIDQVWKDNKALSTFDKHKKKLLFGLVAGATVMTGGAALAGIAAGAVAGFGTYKILDKTWIQGARKRLASNTSELGTGFFGKSFLEADKDMEYWTTEVETRKALSRTSAALAGTAAGMTAVGMATGPTETVVTPPTGEGSSVTIPSEVSTDLVKPDAPVEMGDARVMEEMQPKVEEAIKEMESGAKPAEADMVPEEVPIPEPRPETPNVHTVEKNDNVWNIMEGKGPDANPVGGKSEVLKEMSLAERQHWLDKLVEYYEQHPQEAMEVGAIKSNGNIHMIHPGEEINVSMLDDKLRELMGQGAAEQTSVSISGTEASPAETMSAPETGLSDGARDILPEVQWQDSINDMRTDDVIALHDAVVANDPATLERLEAMGLDKADYMEINKRISQEISSGATEDLELPLSEWLSAHQGEASPAQGGSEAIIDNPPVAQEAEVREANFTPEVANDNSPTITAREVGPTLEAANDNAQAVQNYVNKVEAGGVFDWLFGNERAGSFEKIADLTFGQIQEYARSADMGTVSQQLGVAPSAYEQWMNTLQKEVAKTPPLGPEETVRQYVTRINGLQAAA